MPGRATGIAIVTGTDSAEGTGFATDGVKSINEERAI